MVDNQDNNQPNKDAREEGGKTPSSQNSMRELFEESFQQRREGDVVTGMIVAITDDTVVVDIGFKTEGMIPRSEFTDRQGKVTVKVGDEVDVLVEHFDEMLGEVRLSRERAAKMRVWEVLETAFRDNAPVRGKVLERVKGGLTVDIGVRAFLPGSLVDMRPTRRLEDYVGEEVEARIINFDRRRANVVLSRKAILEEQVSVQKDETLAHLEEGTIVTGVVKNITDYGVFIDLGGIDGLLHVTDISWGRVGHPSEYFKVGDECKVVVLRVDKDKERVSLGYRQRFEDPWTHVEARYPVGKKIAGKVTNVVDYGAFVELEEGVEGLIHVSEMSWTKKVKNPKAVLKSAQEVEVVITEVDIDKRRLSLSLRQAEPNPWEEFATRFRVGSKVKGVVRNLTDFGAFVELEPGVDGLVHISDMAWTRRISHPSEVVTKGQEIEALIIAMDIPNQRISLSIKELMPNEWDQFATAHQVGDEVDGYVTNVTDFGLFVELAPGVEGLCHISEVERRANQPLSALFARGQRARTRLIRIDWNEKRIGLSLRGIVQPEPEESELEQTAEEFTPEALPEYSAETAPAAEPDSEIAAADEAEQVVAAEVTEEVVATEVIEEVVAADVTEETVAAEVTEEVVAAEAIEEVVATEDVAVAAEPDVAAVPAVKAAKPARAKKSGKAAKAAAAEVAEVTPSDEAEPGNDESTS
ncbi:MAG: 30S ribosomal protein S1 [Acidobacteria bacterium]|nr:30S ribosomal protein S1 [Acidobacteriota bacterium]